MPIYEYQCTTNKHRFEVIQKFSDPHVTHCTICGEPVQRLLSSPAIQFKGSGWYVTDYARKGSSNSETSEGKTSENKAASSDSTSKGTDTSTTSSASTPSTGKDSSGGS